MLQTGLVSVTFRNLQPAEIVELVKEAGLDGIEWGGDVHVPHGELGRAAEVRQLTHAAGLQVAAYGSYYKVGCETNPVPFAEILATALALQAPTVRVWAGDQGSAQAEAGWWRKVIADTRQIAAQAARVGLTISFEYHEETLTDTAAAASRLLREVGRANVRSYWQPPLELSFATRLLGLREIAPWLSNLHVFHQSGPEPEPLTAGMPEWFQYMGLVRKLPGDRFCLLEFVQGDSPQQFLADAVALQVICR